jgi:Gram positive anchor.
MPQQPEVVPDVPDNNVVTGEPTTSPEQVTTNDGQANGGVAISGKAGLAVASASGQVTNAASKSADTLPQTNEQQSQLGLLGLLMATILGAFGVERKRRER